MIIDGNRIAAEEGKTLRRIADKTEVGSEYYLGYIYYIGGVKLDEPRLETPADFEELTQEEAEQARRNLYPGLVEAKIRRRFSVSDELALQRQRDAKPQDFEEYYTFCEECKQEARMELGLTKIE